MFVRRALFGVGVGLISIGIVGAAFAIVQQLVGTLLGYSMLVVIMGLQVITIGVGMKLRESDWPPSILFAAGVDVGIRRAEEEQRRARVDVVTPIRRAGGQS